MKRIIILLIVLLTASTAFGDSDFCVLHEWEIGGENKHHYTREYALLCVQGYQYLSATTRSADSKPISLVQMYKKTATSPDPINCTCAVKGIRGGQ